LIARKRASMRCKSPFFELPLLTYEKYVPLRVSKANDFDFAELRFAASSRLMHRSKSCPEVKVKGADGWHPRLFYARIAALES